MRSGGTSASGFAAAPLDFFRPMTLERMGARARVWGRRRRPGDGTRDAGRGEGMGHGVGRETIEDRLEGCVV